MRRTILILTLVAAAIGYANAQDSAMSFFLTSKGPGDGANLGGLEGADAHCQMLAESAGAGGKTLSTGGLTNPASPEPSPASTRPAHIVNINATFIVFISFPLSLQ